MPIAFDCACGKHFSVGAEYAGKRTKCPSCGAPLTVPAPETPVPAPVPVSEEDAAYRALMESPDPEPTASPTWNAPPTREGAEDRPKNAPLSGKTLTPKKAAKFTKPSPEERKARKQREPRGYDPERARKMFYKIGGGLMILGGIALVLLAFEGGLVRAGFFGGMLAFSGVGTLFQGITGNFDDDA